MFKNFTMNVAIDQSAYCDYERNLCKDWIWLKMCGKHRLWLKTPRCIKLWHWSNSQIGKICVIFDYSHYMCANVPSYIYQVWWETEGPNCSYRVREMDSHNMMTKNLLRHTIKNNGGMGIRGHKLNIYTTYKGTQLGWLSYKVMLHAC